MHAQVNDRTPVFGDQKNVYDVTMKYNYVQRKDETQLVHLGRRFSLWAQYYKYSGECSGMSIALLYFL